MFFSVKSPIKIAGKVYTPCICYALPEVLLPTVNKLVNEGKAYIYDHKVAFQNGKVLVKKVETEVKVEKKPSKKSKKEEKLEPEEFVKEDEVVNTDESEGF
jgi:hypothetical protein